MVNVVLDIEFTDRHPQLGNLASVAGSRHIELPDRQAEDPSEFTRVGTLLLAGWTSG